MANLFSAAGKEESQVSHDLSEMLLLVPGEVHQIPQQECLHHGEWASDAKASWVRRALLPTQGA